MADDDENIQKNARIQQYQEKISILTEAQQEVFNQIGNSVKWGAPLKKWKMAMRGALVEASTEENLVAEFEKKWNEILTKHGLEKIKDKGQVPEDAYDELIEMIQDWQQRLGMGFKSKTGNPMSERVRLKEFVNKEIWELIKIYNKAKEVFEVTDSELIMQKLGALKDENPDGEDTDTTA